MTQQNATDTIQTALDKMTAGDLSEASTQLLAALGYRSDRRLDGQTGDVGDFIASFRAENTDTQSEQDFRDSATEVRILFQFTDTEITATAQRPLLEEEAFSAGNARSFLFAAVELTADSYARGRYVSFTREINKRFNRVPAVVIFRTADGRVTLAFVNRRPSKIRADRQVLGSVSLIREINPADPHRAHLDILSELSLPERLAWMEDHGEPRNFDGLLEAWLAALDTEELNKRFYRELYAWFERSLETAEFPSSQAKTLRKEEHVIRLITRLMFVWFIKEKGLVAEDLFIEHQVSQLLKNYDRDGGDSYYRAVMQNLFFATLNTEIKARRFSRKTPGDHRNPSLYRCHDEIADPDRLVELFDNTPFINGGLFDCLDSFDATDTGGYRIDCFSDNPSHRVLLSIPNRLFFGTVAEPGLIDLFNHYKFTVEENTPTEREVALDPELLGKVFENLLAAVNPETQVTARKETGSYYTPRAVVDYMVDEALIATLTQKASPDDGDADKWQDHLRYLLDYGDAFADAETLFTPAEREAIVRAIASIKALDPAVGSGAFPMGILHKLTLALRRLDADNRIWEGLQRQIATTRAGNAFDTADGPERESALAEISRTFDKYRDSDFGRKLYLIQNSIYGVDIQPIATQIAKLRFFISLAIEQQPTADAGDNYGIKPLPNLETRFVAADALLRLQLNEAQQLLQDDVVQTERKAIAKARDKFFLASNQQTKYDLIQEEKRHRAQLDQALENLACQWETNRQREIEGRIAQLPKAEQRQQQRSIEQKRHEQRRRQFDAGLADARKMARWDPHDPNASAADWFNSEFMFGVVDGFDVVIGNPPYIQLQKEQGKLARLYQDAGYQTFARTGDIYYLFYEQGMSLLQDRSGYLCFISSNQWMRVDSGKALREFIESQNPVQLVNLGANAFESVTVNTCVMLVNRSANKNTLQAADVRSAEQPFPPTEWTHIRPTNGETWIVLPAMEQSIKAKMEAAGTPLKNWDVKINYGIKTGIDKAFIVKNETRQAFIATNSKSAAIINPVLRGRDIERYQARHARFLIDTHNGYGKVPAVNIDDYPAVKVHLDGFKPKLEKRYDQGRTPYNLRNCAYHADFAKERIVWGNLNNQAKFAYAPEGMLISAPATMLTPYSPYLLALLNSKMVDWYFRLIGVERDGGYYEYKPMFIERLPIPQVRATIQRPLVRLVDRILKAKAADPAADTSQDEAEIDRLVYTLYGLTDEEIAVVAGA